jgi:hypothetical protein
MIYQIDPTTKLGKFKLDLIKDSQADDFSNHMEKIHLQEELKNSIMKNDGFILKAHKPAFKFFCDEHHSNWKAENPGKNFNDFLTVSNI